MANQLLEEFDGVFHEYMDPNTGQPIRIKGEEQLALFLIQLLKLHLFLYLI